MRKKSSASPDIGGRVKARRQALHLSLRQCAASVGLNTGTLAAIEQGRTTSPSTDHLVRIASFLNLSLDELLHMEDWVCVPRCLHETAIDLSLSYNELCSLNIPPLREAAASKADWKLLVRLSREERRLLAIVEQHPQTLATIATQLTAQPPTGP